MTEHDTVLADDLSVATGQFDSCFDSCGDAGPRGTSLSDGDDLEIRASGNDFPYDSNIRSRMRDSSLFRPETESQGVTLAEFVKSKFVPECVTPRRLAGRTHFQFILKHILTPEQAAKAFGTYSSTNDPKLTPVAGWPYLGSQPLQAVDGNAIQSLTSTALDAGYSTQTAIHIRNVVRSIFGHAIKTKCFSGENPAARVSFPAVVRKTAHSLTVSQLRQAMMMMRYPEKPIALFAILTDMNLSEICGLQWRYVNLLPDPRLVESELLPARTIAVRNQSYRGEFGPVNEGRKRFLPIPNLLFDLLADFRSRNKFTTLQDFVFASRRGTPIYPENIAARRLKAIGKILDMPWISWSAFHRTHLALKSQLGRRLNRELEQVLPLNEAMYQDYPQAGRQSVVSRPGKQVRR